MGKIKEGDIAPEFTGKIDSGETISLKDFRGYKLILYFYPKDNTPGCTAEACNLRDNYDVLLSQGLKIVGISLDSEKSHTKFKEKHNLPFPLIADTDRKISEAYGVYGPKKLMGKEYFGINRTTFIISEKGIIEKIINKVDTKNHSQQILDILEKS
jgi:peroxiredoxin Q/BCP